MATYYMDYENGLDTNGGTSWADAKKTINGFTSLTSGDVVRIAKSPAPVSIGNATWTNLSKTVTLATAQTQTIELCNANWTASTNVTSTTSTTRKEGSYSVSLAIASAFTTGKVAYKSFSALNLSGYQKLSFWIQNNAAITANRLKVCLCSDTAGATIVDTFYIPAIPSTGRFLPLTITKNGGGNLGSSIQSIAIYADTDPGTVTLLLDDFIACTTGGLNLQSLISKNSAEQGGTEGWYGIQSINGTTVLLDNDTNTLANAGKGYSGTTETVTTYKRETIKTALAKTLRAGVQIIQNSGTSGGNIEFQGGYNTSTGNQDGETFFDGLNGCGFGILNGKSYTTLNYLNFSRYYFGIYYDSDSNNNTITTISNANNNSYGIYYYLSNNNIITTFSNANNNTYGIHYETSNNNTITTFSNANNNSYGIYYYFSNNNVVITFSNANNNNYGIYYDSSSDNVIKSLSTSGNSVAGICNSYGNNYLSNALMAETTEISGFIDFINSKIYSQNHDQTADNHWIFTDNGTIHSQTAVRHTDSGIAWQLSPISNFRYSNYPLDLSVAKIAVEANKEVSIKAWLRRSNTGLTMRLIVKGKQIAGVDNDVYADLTAGANTWQEVSLAGFTPTEKGVIEVQVLAWGGVSYSGFIDDLTISQS